jgi:hypothetical protein
MLEIFMQININKILKLFIIVIAITTGNSCSFVAKKMTGIKKPKMMNERLHARYLKKFKAPADQAYLIDTNYIGFFELLDTSRFREQKKNHFQAMQALYYGHNQFQEAWFINCYASGFPNLNWNLENNFGTFPPKTAAPLDSLVSFDRLIAHAQPFRNHPRHKVGEREPYTVVFIWSRTFKKQSKRLHKVLIENLKMCNKPYRIIYINNDNIYAQSDVTTE